jgi:hypothetical protein
MLAFVLAQNSQARFLGEGTRYEAKDNLDTQRIRLAAVFSILSKIENPVGLTFSEVKKTEGKSGRCLFPR